MRLKRTDRTSHPRANHFKAVEGRTQSATAPHLHKTIPLNPQTRPLQCQNNLATPAHAHNRRLIVLKINTLDLTRSNAVIPDPIRPRIPVVYITKLFHDIAWLHAGAAQVKRFSISQNTKAAHHQHTQPQQANYPPPTHVTKRHLVHPSFGPTTRDPLIFNAKQHNRLIRHLHCLRHFSMVAIVHHVAYLMRASNTFKPPLYLTNPHVQSIMNSLGPRKVRAHRIRQQLATTQLTLTAKDGTRLLADYDISTPSNGAIVVMIHGWEGSSASAYQVTTAQTLLNHGFDVLRLNLRDHGNSHHLNKGIFNSTLTVEVADAILHFMAAHAYKKRFFAGFSLGGNFALRIAADHGSAIDFDAVVAISPPVDPVNAMIGINNALFIYRAYFYRRWTQSLKKKLFHFPDYNFHDDLALARSLDDINATFIPRFTPFENPTAYFSAYGLTGDRLAQLAVPAYLIAAADDPVVPSQDITKIAEHKLLTIDLQIYGGHCGFIENMFAESWVELRLVDIFNAHF